MSFDFCTISKILICLSLIKHFPSDHKRYFSHLQVSVLLRVAPINFYLTIYDSLKKQLFKKCFRTINKRFWLTSMQGLPYTKTASLGLKLVNSFINFIIPLPVAYIRHVTYIYITTEDWQSVCLSKYRIFRLLRQKDCRGPTEVNDGFKLVPRQLNYRRFYS